MVRLRLLVLISMLVGVLQVNPMMGAQRSTAQKANEVVILHAESGCAICKEDIKESYWPDVVVLRCSNDDNEHGMIVHTACAQIHKDTHECATCSEKLSEESKQYVDHVRTIKQNPDALTNPASPLYQRYTSKAEAADCSICISALTTWPDTIVLHANHPGVGHAFHRKCIQEYRNGLSPREPFTCPACRQNINAEKAMLDTLQDSFGLEYIQKYEKLKVQAVTPIQRPSKSSAVVNAIKNYRLLRYPALGVIAALTLYGMYTYRNAELLSVSEAVTGMGNATCTGGCLGFIAALVHYVHDWYGKK